MNNSEQKYDCTLNGLTLDQLNKVDQYVKELKNEDKDNLIKIILGIMCVLMLSVGLYRVFQLDMSTQATVGDMIKVMDVILWVIISWGVFLKSVK